MSRLKIGVLGSGSGSNMQSIVDEIEAGRLDAEVRVVLADVPDAKILDRAKRHGIPCQYLDCAPWKTKLEGPAEDRCIEILKDAGVDTVVLAGFMRIVKPKLLAAFPNRVLNIHPALLPACPFWRTTRPRPCTRASRSRSTRRSPRRLRSSPPAGSPSKAAGCGLTRREQYDTLRIARQIGAAQMVVLGTIDLKKTFKIPGQKPIEVLKGVNFSVFPGEKVAIVGRSGAGKSTLLNILGGLEKPTSGSVTRPQNIGFVFQQYHLMPELTVYENVLLPTMSAKMRALVGGAAGARRARELLEQVGLGDRLRHLPSELSGGEQQRVALARALVTDPELVLADEPTGNLDAMTGSEILRMLADLSAGTSVSLVMVTHSPEAAAICDRVLTLEGGVLR